MKLNRESAASWISLMGWFFAFCCFIPIFVLHSQSSQQELTGVDIPSNITALNFTLGVDDYLSSYIVGGDELPVLREASISALMVSIPLGLDTLLDLLPAWVNTWLFAESRKLPVKKSGMTVYHLNLAEKCSFIVGMICLSTISFSPVRSYETPAILYLTFLNLNTILMACPILAFLTRCAPTWTPLRSGTIAFLVCSVTLLGTFANLMDPTTAMFATYLQAVQALITISFGLFVLVCGMSAVNTFWFQLPYEDEGARVGQSAAATTTGDSNSAQDAKKLSTDRFHNCVIASHMFATFISAIVNPVWYFEIGKLTTYDFSILMYLVIASAFIVYITEFRVRKSEVTTALLDLLDAKKSYVRYISHELRTPMNAAFLGLKFVTDNMKDKAENDPDTAETYETLCDVQTACSTAVDILNDLLTFEKLESGILELHKTEVRALDLVRDCVSLFSAQAREKSIHLDCEMELADSDILKVDKFKIDQVLRNLISNAIKFSPSGGTVTVRTYFEMSVRDDQEPKQRSADVHDVEIGYGKSCGNLLSGKLVVKVADEGAGISLRNQKRLFNEMVQFNPDKLQAGGGSGFGLFICKGIVDLHGGKISVFSEGEGKGCTFTLELPMVRTCLPSSGTNHTTNSAENVGTSVVTRRFEMGFKRRDSTRSAASVTAAVSHLRRHSRVSQASRDREEDKLSVSSISRVGSNASVDNVNEGITITGRHIGGNISHTEIVLHLDGSDADAISITDNNKFTHKKDNKVTSATVCASNPRAVETSPLTADVSERNSGKDGDNVETVPDENLSSWVSPLRDHKQEQHLVVPSQAQEPEHMHQHQHQHQQGTEGSNVLAEVSKIKTPTQRYEILVVDDSPMNRKMLIKILKVAGHVCEEAEDGVKAVEKVKQRMSTAAGEMGKKEYDAILMDFVMPNMDGPTATKELRGQGYRGVIFGVTGNGLESDIRHFEICGANKVLVKPFKLEEFKAHMDGIHNKKD